MSIARARCRLTKTFFILERKDKDVDPSESGSLIYSRKEMAKKLIGMVHLEALPGSPSARLPLEQIEERATAEAAILHEAGFDATIVENFGDVPFAKDDVASITVASMARIACSIRRTVPELGLGINVLRNDARAALAVAFACEAQFVRINVHVGATATDQGVIEGRAAETLRERMALRTGVEIWADVHVKHGKSLAHEDIADEARDAAERGMADALIVSGAGTGQETSLDELARVSGLELKAPIYVGSGVSADSVADFLRIADGVIVGSALKSEGIATNALERDRAMRFVDVARKGDS